MRFGNLPTSSGQKRIIYSINQSYKEHTTFRLLMPTRVARPFILLSGREMLAQRFIILVLMMINSCSYYTNDLVFSKSQIDVKILVGV